jgi:hypothetical protein
MTAGYDGNAETPEDDDPFAYLYRSESGEQPDPAAGRPGTPRSSYHQVQRVGERRPQQPPAQGRPGGGYGYPPPQGYGQQQPYPQAQGMPQQQPYQQQPQQSQPYGQTYEYTAPHAQPPGGGGHRGGGPQGPDAPSRKGLLIAAVAVVVAVAVGIAFAMTNSSGDDKKDKAGTTPGSTTSTSAPAVAPSTRQTPSDTPTTPFASQKTDAATLLLTGGAQTSTQWPGAGAANGTYVDHMNAVGATATWNVTVPEDGPYTFFISYGNAGPDANLTLVVNGTPRTDPVNLLNYGHYTDWSKAWDNHTFNWVDLKKGPNSLVLTCAPGQSCGVNLDQVWLKQGHVKK